MKGYCPTSDPGWRHSHVPTGETRTCVSSDCSTSWLVLCHNATRYHCDPCREGRKRNQSRERMRAKRERDRESKAIYDAERHNLVWDMAYDLAENGSLSDDHLHYFNKLHGYRLRPARDDYERAVAEADILCGVFASDELAALIEQEVEMEAELVAESKAAKAAGLESSLSLALAAGDAEAVGIIRDRLRKLTVSA